MLRRYTKAAWYGMSGYQGVWIGPTDRLGSQVTIGDILSRGHMLNIYI